MKILRLGFFGILLSFVGFAQQAEIVDFRHDLRWLDEARFPNYFLQEEVRDTIFNVTKQEIANYLGLTEVKLPEDVSYKIFTWFGKQRAKMPKGNPENDYEVGIYSFITRATVGYSVLWNFNIVIKKKGKVILTKEVMHELEYFNVSGYLTSVKWFEADEFQDLFIRMLRESLGVLPTSNEVIVIGDADYKEEKAQALFTESTRYLLKIDGNWRIAGNFVAQLESPKEKVLDVHFKEKFSWEFPKPSFSDILAQLFSDMTGVEVVLEELVDREREGAIVFSDGDELGILLKWIEMETSSTFSDEAYSQRITNELITELYTKDKQIGYFVYAQEEIVYTSEKTELIFSPIYILQTINSLGVERIHRIEGELYERPILAEYNENKGIIEVKSGEELLGVMVIQNVNPDNRSVSNEKLSKNKKFITQANLGKSSLEETNSVEWYPIYLSNDFSVESGKLCIETLIFLFFGIGYM